MASTLRQELFLGVLPPGLKFTITQAAVFCNPGGYNVTWRDTRGFNVSNMDGRCFNAGNQFAPREPARNPGKTCVMASNFSATIASGGQPVRLGEMTWARANTLDIFAQAVPGSVELRFEISKASGGALAAGTLKVTPSRFKTFERPDDIDFLLTWDNGRTETGKTSVAPDIGVDPPKVHLMFVPGQDGKSLGVTLTPKEDVLNAISSMAVRGILYANKKVVEFGVPGGAVVIKVVELPETIDTVRDIYSAGDDFISAIQQGDRNAAFVAAMKVAKGIYDVGSGIADLPGDLKGFNGQVSEMLLGKLPTNFKDMSETLRDDIISKIVDEAINQADAKRRRRRLARRKYLGYE
ncbi:hypothetical protein TWF225_004385 [Orbilia oligospora]|nr:hypothetical protein TWF225_004385 [Orbilia oligospora]KAF3260029.1 hypothetical protein TWF217_005054 [Orbilia oligospora]KAF3267110.1 hypothetical protein TWF128_010065 [Orbilia oligospora]